MKWINIKDKAPNDSQDVLVWGDGHSVSLAWYWEKDGNIKQGFYKEGFGHDGSEAELKEWVTHWMPKPLPPNENAKGVTREHIVITSKSSLKEFVHLTKVNYLGKDGSIKEAQAMKDHLGNEYFIIEKDKLYSR